MASLLDASLWIDLTRWRSPRYLKEFIAPYVLDPEACIAEPVVFEVLRHATDEELTRLQTQFATMHMLATPPISDDVVVFAGSAWAHSTSSSQVQRCITMRSW